MEYLLPSFMCGCNVLYWAWNTPIKSWGQPAWNTYIERFNRTARQEWLELNLFEDIEQAQTLATHNPFSSISLYALSGLALAFLHGVSVTVFYVWMQCSLLGLKHAKNLVITDLNGFLWTYLEVLMAESKRFELLIRCRIHAFQACAFGHSASSPHNRLSNER